MKFSHVLLAAPFVAGALAKPTPMTEEECNADATMVWKAQQGKCLPVCAEGEKRVKGVCMPEAEADAMKEQMKKDKENKNKEKNNKGNNNKGKNNKGKNNKGKGNKGKNNKGKNNKGKNNKGKNDKGKGNKNEKPEKPELTEEEKQQKKEDKMAKIQAAKDKYAADNNCDLSTHEVLGKDKDSFSCEQQCAENLFRGWADKAAMCHDCTDTSVYKLLTEDKEGNALEAAICKKLSKKEIWAAANSCDLSVSDVFGKDSDEFQCVDKCATGLFRGVADGAPMCHDCSDATMFQLMTEDKEGNALDAPKCMKINDDTKDNKKDNNKKDSNKKNNNKKDKKPKVDKAALDQLRADWAKNNDCDTDVSDVFGRDTDEKPFVCVDKCAEGLFRGFADGAPMCHDCSDSTVYELVTEDKDGNAISKCKKIDAEGPMNNKDKDGDDKPEGPKGGMGNNNGDENKGPNGGMGNNNVGGNKGPNGGAGNNNKGPKGPGQN